MSQQDELLKGAPASNGLAPAKLGIWSIVFFVVSAAAPLTVVVSAAPTMFRFGGIGAPGALLACGIILAFFAVGFTAMSRHVRNAGAFYIYAAKGLGKPVGIGIALVTVFAYGLLCVSFYGYIGFFASLTFSELLHVDLPWGVYSVVSLLLVGILGYRHIDVGAKVLGVLLTLEVLILLILSVAVLTSGGSGQLSGAPFDPKNVFFAAGAGSLFVVGFGAYLGFEGTAIYAEEAKNSRRTVPVATYVAVAFLGLFYAFTFWILTVAFGLDGIMRLANSDTFENMAFDATSQYLGAWATIVMRILIVTSFFACLLAFHNACSRYIFSLAREGLLPGRLARTHPVSSSPYRASMLMTAVSMAVVVLALVAGLDPFLKLGVYAYSAGVAGLVFAQGVAAISVIGFFRRDRHGHGLFRAIVAPTIGAIGLLVGLALIVGNFSIVTGLSGPINWILLLPTPILFVGGIVWGLIMRRRMPARYATLTTVSTGALELAD